MGFGIKKEAGSNSTPSQIVNFDKLTPTTAGVVFTPNTPATLDVLYLSSVDASTWIWNGTAYVTYTPPATATTEWYLYGTTIDAGSNKTAAISRDNSIYTVGYDSYFNSVRVGRGNNNISTNTVVGIGSGGAISTGSSNSFFGANSGIFNSSGNYNSFFGTYAGYSTTFANSNTFIGNSAGYNNNGDNNTFNGYQSGYNNTTASYNTFYGYVSGYSNTTGQYNTFVGLASGYSNTTAQYNTFVGYAVGNQNTTGSFNAFFGENSGYFNTTGQNNSFFGSSSGYANIGGAYNAFFGVGSGYNNNGSNNTFLGANSGQENTTGANNTFNGYQSGYNNTTAVDNTFIGKYSGFSTTTGGGNTGNGVESLYSNTTGTSNVANGGASLYSNTTGGGNTSNGRESLYSSTTGYFNTASGYRAGRYIADGTTALTASGNSVFLGADTKALADNQTNQIVIGYNAIGKGSNTVNIGNTSITNTYLNGAVTFNNAFTFPTTDGTANQVLKTNGSGTVTWGTAGSSSGIWGISNASGVYTYYATWALAVAAATAGQCIELFADITESSVSYTLKNGVNINGNGHTISSNTATATLTDGGVAVVCDVSNLIISKSLGGALSMTSTASNITGNCKIISTDVSYDCCIVYGQLTGWSINGSAGYPFALYSTGILNFININTTGARGIVSYSTTCKINNCIIKTNGNGITSDASNGGIVNNCTVNSNGIAISIATGEINNCSATSNTSVAIGLGAGSSANNCFAKSSAGIPISATLTSKFNDCTIIAEANALSNASTNFSNCVMWSKIDWVLNAGGGGKVINCHLISGYNNVSGWVINEPTSNTYVIDCILEVANSGTTAIRSTSTPTLYLKGNSVKGTVNFKSAGIVNGQTNTADAQGNVILQ